jgi:glycerol-3-phosphate acyltransferase PlsY
MPDPFDWSLALPYLAAALAFGYLCGSIPFGLILTRAGGLGDVRAIGSGNIGATNVLRTGNKRLAAATLVLDVAKGAFAAWAGARWGPDTAILAGLGAFLGHIWPVWLRFRGGKGVATFIGVLAGLFWPAAFVFCAVWMVVAAITRYSSASALAATAATPAVLYWFQERQLAELFALMGVIVFVTHRANIARLVRGEESKIFAGSREVKP